MQAGKEPLRTFGDLKQFLEARGQDGEQSDGSAADVTAPET
jgi:hypothetical protein